jgi:hypothetical protein
MIHKRSVGRTPATWGHAGTSGANWSTKVAERGTMDRTLYIFRHATDARAFNAREPGRRADFEFLPFAFASAGLPAPAPDLLRSCLTEYPSNRGHLLGGIDWLVDPRNEIDVLNLSLGVGSGAFDRKDPLQIATRFVYDQGIPVVVAAGNSGPAEGTLQVLAQAPWTIAVGASEWGHNDRLLDSSSRGILGGRGPTVVSTGHPEVTYVDVPNTFPDFEQGTSFAAARISHLVVWIKKCLQLISDNVRDVQQGTWSPEGPPIRLSTFGIADTGCDPRTLDPLPPEVQALVDAGENSVRLAREERQRQWLSQWLTALDSCGVTLTPAASPAFIKRALQGMASPMPEYRLHEVGAGYVFRQEVEVFFKTLTPVRLTWLFYPEIKLSHKLDLEDTLKQELGPLWDQQFVQTTQTYFYFGQRLAVAKVI